MELRSLDFSIIFITRKSLTVCVLLCFVSFAKPT